MSEFCPTCKRPFNKGRSSNQNRYYWSVIVGGLSEHTGFSPDEIHEILKHKFLSFQRTWNDLVFYIPKSTSSLTTIQMEKYLTSIREWASAELGCWLPEPNEVLDEHTN